jgi:putative ABC transport system ATP-binding protein
MSADMWAEMWAEAAASATPRGLSVRCEELVHIYRLGDSEVVAVRGVDLEVQAGEMVALLGPSGSGKSTLLGLLGGLLVPSAGRLWVGEEEIGRMNQRELLRLRSDRVGYVLQGSARNLLPYVSPLDNVRFARRSLARRRRRIAMRAEELLEVLGLSTVARKPLASLSGGEQQRTALAVAVANGPGLLLADEPTSQLDRESRTGVLDLLRTVNDRFGTTVVIVTHDADVGAALGRQVLMRYGRVGQEARSGRRLAVIGKDGSVHLPDELLQAWPPGTLVRVEPEGDGLRVRREQTP